MLRYSHFFGRKTPVARVVSVETTDGGLRLTMTPAEGVTFDEMMECMATANRLLACDEQEFLAYFDPPVSRGYDPEPQEFHEKPIPPR